MLIFFSVIEIMFFRRKVSIEDAENYKTDMKFDLFMEASAKTGFNAKNVITNKFILGIY